MPIYVMLTKLTQEGRLTIKKHPERIEEMVAEVAKMGVKTLAQYALLGPYDFLSVVEAPDNDTISRASLECGSRGTIRIMSLPAMTVRELVQKLTQR